MNQLLEVCIRVNRLSVEKTQETYSALTPEQVAYKVWLLRCPHQPSDIILTTRVLVRAFVTIHHANNDGHGHGGRAKRSADRAM